MERVGRNWAGGGNCRQDLRDLQDGLADFSVEIISGKKALDR